MELSTLCGSEKKRTRTTKTIKKEIEQIGYVRKHDKVQLLGTAGSLQQTRWDDKNSDIWACAPVVTNPAAKGHIDSIDLLFEMHHMEYWITIIDRLNNTNIPVYMQTAVPQIKKSMTYPLKEVQDMCINEKMRKYFTSTISYMIALAIKMGYKEIELYGIHMASNEEEYSRQKSCCDAWMAFADAKGIDWYIPDESQLFKCNFLYGYEQVNDAVFKLIKHQNSLRNGLVELERQKIEINKKYSEQNGAIVDIDKLIQII